MLCMAESYLLLENHLLPLESLKWDNEPLSSAVLCLDCGSFQVAISTHHFWWLVTGVA